MLGGPGPRRRGRPFDRRPPAVDDDAVRRRQAEAVIEGRVAAADDGDAPAPRAAQRIDLGEDPAVRLPLGSKTPERAARSPRR